MKAIYSLVPKVENAIRFKFEPPKSQHRIENEIRYQDPAWTKLSYRIRCERPNCENCLKYNVLTIGTVVHHIVPWRTGTTDEEQDRLFWDIDNLQVLCYDCHSKIHKTLIENR